MKSEASGKKVFEGVNGACLLDDVTLSQILSTGKRIQLDLGDTLPADANNSSYVLISGGIRLLKTLKNGEQFTTALLDEKGQIFGSRIIVQEPSDLEVARATETTIIVQFDKTTISKLCESNSAFRDKLLRWELIHFALNKLKDLPQWQGVTATQIQKLLADGNLVQLSAGQSLEVTIPHVQSGVLLCSGNCEMSGKGDYSALQEGTAEKVLDSEADTISLRAKSTSTIFIGQFSNIKNILDDGPQREPSLQAIQFQPESSNLETKHEEKSTGKETPTEISSSPINWVRKKFHQYPMIVQMSAMDCGVACLAMVIAYFGSSVSMNRLRELAKVTNQGTDLKSLSDAAETVGFLARGVKANYEGLLQLNLPLICHWGSNHYVVLYEIDAAEVTIADPADDLLTLPRSKFLERYSGFALELTPTVQLASNKKEMPALGRYTALLKTHKKSLIDIALASVIIQILMLATPLFTQVIVDKVLIHQSLSMLNVLLLGMILLSLFQTVVSALRSYFMAFTGMKLDQALFVQFYKHVLSLPLAFFEERTQGDIMTRFAENRKIRELMSGSTLATLIDVLMAFAYLAIIFFYNFSFGIFTLIYIGFFAVIAFAVAPTLRTIRRRCFHKDVAANSFLLESVRGIEKIKSAASENRTRWAWELRFVDALNANFKGTLVARSTQLLCELVHIAGNVVLLWFGAHLVIQETISIGQLMAMNLMVARISEPILHVVDVWDELQDVTVSLERLNDVLDQTPEEVDSQSKLVLPSLEGKIRFDQVTFRYQGNTSKNALQNVSFTIEPGQMIGIAGRSGCGKSTLLKLVQGLYPPTDGRVFMDDHDLSHISLSSLRTKVGVVAQHEYLFRGSIREAISYYDPEATAQQVIEAAKMAGIHDFISTLPRGYDYELTEGGSNLSGGQRQRLAIARAIVHNPKILIFDEATSFLDSESEKAIQSSLAKLRGNRTMIVVAHRLSTIREADTIFVMDRGQIIETGSHAALLKQKGLYYYLCQQQTIE
ncbi:MAG: ABC transporter ATP-binding protein [Candidatus Melainabacteria bacterium]|nr:MAG: ABC transporter ATP-binding protein [Candidatus Melainabacteria bacterium]